MMRGDGFKAFVGTLPGKIALVALAVAVVVGSFAYVGVLIAIGAFLLFMLFVPIYFGWKRPRELAVAGLVGLLVAAPLASLVFANEFRTPVGAVSSDSQNGGSVLRDAQVHPFTGDQGAVYNFTVTVNPKYLPAGAHAPEYLVVFLSTCDGAITNNDSNCGSGGYPFWVLNTSYNVSLSSPTAASLHQKLSLPSIWYWLMAFVYQDSANRTTWIWVDPGAGNPAIQGPVVGDFASTVTYVLPDVLIDMLLYVGLVFAAGLLVYMFLKNRRARREAAESAPGPAGLPSGSAPGASTGPTTRVAGNERSCPSCGAVIYPAETSCWKCGASLATSKPATSPPLS